jgi:hypothetical protein
MIINYYYKIYEKRNACRISGGKPEGKRPLGIPRYLKRCRMGWYGPH